MQKPGIYMGADAIRRYTCERAQNNDACPLEGCNECILRHEDSFRVFVRRELEIDRW